MAVLPGTTDLAEREYTTARRAHWDAVARRSTGSLDFAAAYHARLVEVYRSLIPANSRVLEIGCGQGDLLGALEPAFGVGVDFSAEMLNRARCRHPHLKFLQADAHQLDLHGETFDVVVLSDVVNDLWDVEAVLGRLRRVMRPDSRLIVNFYSRLWELPLDATRSLGLSKPLLEQNWLTLSDVDNLLRLADLELTRHWDEILLPLPAAGLEQLANRVLVKVWPLDQAALTHFVVARPSPGATRYGSDSSARPATC